MVQDILWKAESHSAFQTIASFLYGTRRFITVLTSPPLDPILSKENKYNRTKMKVVEILELRRRYYFNHIGSAKAPATERR
jgi:hypothetical protein